MPLLNSTPQTPPTPAPNPIQAYKPSYRGTTVDTQYTPATSLLTYIAGSPMPVNYYSQVLNRDSNVDGQNVTRNANLQPYNLIQNFVLKVTTPLDFQQVVTNKAVGYTGSANVFPKTVIPNTGDMFLTDIGDGREGIFRVTDSNRLSIHADTAYSINYVLVAFSDTQQGQEMLADLAQKTIQTYTFMQEFIQFGENPILLASDAQIVYDLKTMYQLVLNDWVESFASNEFKTFMIPGQPMSSFDWFLVNAVKSTFDANEHPLFQEMRQMNVSGSQDMQTPTIWDIFIQRNTRLLFRINRRMALSSTRMFSRNPMMETIAFSGIRYIVYPLRPQQSWDDKMNRRVVLPAVSQLKDVESREGRLEELIPETQLNGLPYAELPIIKQITDSDFYIFSEDFYNQNRTLMSRLELSIWDFIEGKPANLPLLKLFAETLPAWGALEQYYYTPFVLLMIKDAIKGMSS